MVRGKFANLYVSHDCYPQYTNKFCSDCRFLLRHDRVVNVVRVAWVMRVRAAFRAAAVTLATSGSAQRAVIGSNHCLCILTHVAVAPPRQTRHQVVLICTNNCVIVLKTYISELLNLTAITSYVPYFKLSFSLALCLQGRTLIDVINALSLISVTSCA